MSGLKHFLDLNAVSKDDLREILDIAIAFKHNHSPLGGRYPFQDKSLALIFEKPSTRTRVSFEVGMKNLGGNTVVLQGSDIQIGRGETIADTARVLSRYVDAIMIRTDDPEKLAQLAEHGTVPVINGLTDDSHPCQIMADILTFEEHRGPIEGKAVAWIGDGNNVANSWIHAAAQFDLILKLACPEGYTPDERALAWARENGGEVIVTADPSEAVAGSDLVVTDTWVSMGDTDADKRMKDLAPYQVNEALMGQANKDALFMHCLPAHRGEEVSSEVLDGPQSVVWDEAENRMHAQNGILSWVLI
ncbi:MAG: ornithine carbamoyltransferase [Rhodospirillales bacterium]|nr:ornithine carbamoyltransferase [Rhodospirillales bacterium]